MPDDEKDPKKVKTPEVEANGDGWYANELNNDPEAQKKHKINVGRHIEQLYREDQKRRSGPSSRYLTSDVPAPLENERLEQYATRLAYMSGGAGGYYNQLATYFRGFDRFTRSMLPSNNMHKGYTFITRPLLNLTNMQCMMDPHFVALMNEDPLTVPFAIRCLLDHRWADSHREMTRNCPLYQPASPFIPYVGNSVIGMTGWPDNVLYTETTEGGYFGEDLTLAIGTDRLSKTFDISVTFRDIQGSPVLALFDYWTKWIGNAADGIQTAYADAIESNRLDYTCSIYRFTLDPTQRYIMWWSKGTGCFPKSPPVGALFNMNQGEVFVEAAGTVTVPFTVNHVSYNDPRVLKQFNILMDRYAKGAWANQGYGIDVGGSQVWDEKTYSMKPINNFLGLPYIVTRSRGQNEIVWRALAEETGLFAGNVAGDPNAMTAGSGVANMA
jgi:hypothetical protein